MKIKRYEAATMTDALRKIKKELGENAVILSAKTAKKAAGLFGTSKDCKVIVTAAIDMTPPNNNKHKEEMEMLDDYHLEQHIKKIAKIADEANASPKINEEIDKRKNLKNIELSSIDNNPIDKSRPKLVQLLQESEQSNCYFESLNDALYKQLRVQGISASIAHEIAEEVFAILPNSNLDDPKIAHTLARAIENRRWIAEQNDAKGTKQLPIVLVGVHGVGKTTTAAKLAADSIINTNGQVAILSMDYQRIAAHVELERAAYVMGIKMLTTSSIHELTKMMPQINSFRRVVIDTTGIAIGDNKARDELSQMISILGNVEIHLVINACMQENIASRIIEFYQSIGVKKLLFTQIDNTDKIGHIFNLTEKYKLPVRYMGYGAHVPGDLHLINSELISKMLLIRSNYSEETQLSVCNNETGINTIRQNKLNLKNKDNYNYNEMNAQLGAGGNNKDEKLYKEGKYAREAVCYS